MMFKRLKEIFSGQSGNDRITDTEEKRAANNQVVNTKGVPERELNYNSTNYDKPLKDIEPGKAEW